MVAPDSFEGDVHAFLAFAGCPDDHSIDINDRFVEKRLGLLTPDIHSRRMNGRSQRVQIIRREPATKISGCRGIRNRIRSNRVQQSFVVA